MAQVLALALELELKKAPVLDLQVLESRQNQERQLGRRQLQLGLRVVVSTLT